MQSLYGLIAKVFGEWLRQWWFVRKVGQAARLSERVRIRREIEKIREQKRRELAEDSRTGGSPVDLAERADRATGGRYDIYD